jgi:hypothetical protein
MIKLCCAARDGKAQRYTTALPSSDESQTNAVPQLTFPPAETEGSVLVSGSGTPRDSGSDRTSKSRGRMVSPRSIMLGAARRLTRRSSRRGSGEDGSSRESEATHIVDPAAFHDALVAGWLDCVPVPPGQSQLLGGDAPIEAPKAKRFNRRWAAVWHDRVAWYDGGREAASLQLTHATVVAAVAGNGACLACLSGEHGVYLSFPDEAEAEAWAGHIRSATVLLLAQHEELEKAEVALIRMYIIRAMSAALYNMQQCARAHTTHADSCSFKFMCFVWISLHAGPAFYLRPYISPMHPRRRNGRRRSRIRGATGRLPQSPRRRHCSTFSTRNRRSPRASDHVCMCMGMRMGMCMGMCMCMCMCACKIQSDG